LSVARADHSGLMLAARITLPYFSVLSEMSWPNSAADIGIGMSPKSRSRSRHLARNVTKLPELLR
jgi:hypothetical protein